MRPVRVVIFAKAPVAGFAKTRLIPALGPQRAAALARRMLMHTLAQVTAAGIGPVEVCVTPSMRHPAWEEIELPAGVTLSNQGSGDLGARLAAAARRVLGAGEAVVLLGTDCPQLGIDHLRVVARILEAADAVMIPAADGGYVLLGLSRFDPAMFTGITWSTDAVAAQTAHRADALGWTMVLLPTLHDIDEPHDLRWMPMQWLHGDRA